MAFGGKLSVANLGLALSLIDVVNVALDQARLLNTVGGGGCPVTNAGSLLNCAQALSAFLSFFGGVELSIVVSGWS